jgi:hypothetical protein
MEVFGLGLKIKEEGAATVEASLKRLALQVTGTVLSIKTITGALSKLVTATSEAQKAQAQLAATLKSTEGVSGQTQASINAHAAALQRMTSFGDDAIIGAQSLLLMFDKIRNETFPQATKTVLDLAQAMGMDLNSAAMLLGKALQSPEQAAAALTRAKIKLSKEQESLIQKFMAVNDVAKAQGVILDAINQKVGGSAEAYRKTLGGALDALKEAWGDLFEVSEEKSAGVVSAIESITETLPKLSDALNVSLLTFDVWIGELVKGWSQLELKIAKFNLTMAEFNEKYAFLGMGLFDKSQFSANIKKETERIAALEATLGGIDTVIEERLVKLGKALGGATEAATGTQVSPAGASGAMAADEAFDKLRLQRAEEREAASLKRRTEEFKTAVAINRRIRENEEAELDRLYGFKRIREQADLGGVAGLKTEMDAIAKDIGTMQIPPMGDKLLEAIRTDDIKNTLADGIGSAVENGILSGLEMGLAGGNIGDAFKAMGQAIVQSMARAMVNVAISAIKLGELLQRVRDFMVLNPKLAVFTAVALLALARSMGGGAASGGMSATGGVGGLSYGMTGASASTLPTQQIIFGQTSATTAAGMTPRQAMNVTVIGPNDPSAQRAIQELMTKANSRGRIG